MPLVADDVTSLTAIDRTTHRGTAFTTTQWSVVLAAQGPSPAAQAALGRLCSTYGQPIYSFVRRQGAGSEGAKDLTQGFFALLLERRNLDVVRKEKGRRHCYLHTSLKHFRTNERNRAMAIKRGEGQRLIPLEDLREPEDVGFGPTNTFAADQIYERGWALAFSGHVLTRLGDEYRAAGPASSRLFDQLQKLLTAESAREANFPRNLARDFLLYTCERPKNHL